MDARRKNWFSGILPWLAYLTIASTALWLAGCGLRGTLPAQPVRSTMSEATPDDAVLLAVGDIAQCGWTEDEETAALMAEHPATMALLGDTVYLDGTAEEFAECFDPACAGQP